MRIVYRDMKPEDRDFVVATWCSSLRRSPSSGMIARSRWFGVMEIEVKHVLDRAGVRVLVVKDLDAPAGVDLFGHLVWEPDALRAQGVADSPLVYFCYVKKDYRGSGFARGLFTAAKIPRESAYNFVCQTPAVMSLREAGKMPRATWRPNLGRLEPHERTQDDRHQQEHQA